MNDHRPLKDHAFEPIAAEDARELEDTLWWMVGRRSIIRNYLELAKQHMPLHLIMDVGCGSGGNLDLLSRYATVIGVERSRVLADRAAVRNAAIKIIMSDVLDLEPEESVTMFTMFDVLEHIEHDDDFIRKLSTLGSPSHLLLISVPACRFLYSQHDELLHHHRRYSRETLRDLLTSNDYDVLASSYFLFFIFPVVLLSRITERITSAFGWRRMQPNIGVVPRWLNWALIRIIQFEAFLGSRFRYPVGVWLFALAIYRGRPDTPGVDS